MGSPPGSPYAVSVELMITTIFSAWSTSLQGRGPHGPPAFAGSTTTPSNWSNKQHPTPTP